MNLSQVDAICRQAQQAKRQGRVLEAMRILEDCIGACERDKSEKLCFAPLYKSLAKLYYVQQDFAKAQDLYFQAIDIYESCGIEHEAGICLMHLGACSEEFIRSRPFQTYLWSLETGSYAGVPEEMSIGIGELGLRLGAVTYDKLAGQRS
jgi:tetratricopeptide (TPR) repeat protein